MSAIEREVATPSSIISTEQMNRSFLGRDHFTFDVAHRMGGLSEMYEVFGEVIDDDIYNLQHDTREGDVWVDAGCHVGLFSIAALMAGADVSVMIDMDNDSAWCADYNVIQYLRQEIIRGEYHRRRILPTAFVEHISSVDHLMQAGMLTREQWEGMERSCLKLDIQGTERELLVGGGWGRLAEAFDFMVMEWHYPVVPYDMEYEGWRVVRHVTHKDILLSTDTHIVWAQSG